ncbi:hypothetical protein AGLY_017081 [Aphis glycines]|uniref:Uncharacterized protein n=1 Tax=Aphis glycines TaxID=307491 RepID=A0A6G0SVW9_APHGL|nr:hypothetical protein AGLY_017081 [Aphis glycines]
MDIALQIKNIPKSPEMQDPNVVNHPHILYNLSSIIFDIVMSSIKLFKRKPWSTHEYPMDCLAIFFFVLPWCLGNKFLLSLNVLDFYSSKSMKDGFNVCGFFLFSRELVQHHTILSQVGMQQEAKTMFSVSTKNVCICNTSSGVDSEVIAIICYESINWHQCYDINMQESFGHFPTVFNGNLINTESPGLNLELVCYQLGNKFSHTSFTIWFLKCVPLSDENWRKHPHCDIICIMKLIVDWAVADSTALVNMNFVLLPKHIFYYYWVLMALNSQKVRDIPVWPPIGIHDMILKFFLLRIVELLVDYELSRFSLNIDWYLVDLIIINCLCDL